MRCLMLEDCPSSTAQPLAVLGALGAGAAPEPEDKDGDDGERPEDAVCAVSPSLFNPLAPLSFLLPSPGVLEGCSFARARA